MASQSAATEVLRAPLDSAWGTDQRAAGSDTEPAAPIGDGAGSVSAQVARAGSWGLAGRSVLLLVNFIATPFTIRLLGPAAYGLWALIQAVLMWATLAEGGMGVATTKYGSECYGRGDDVGEATIVWSALSIVVLATSAAALAFSLGAHFLLTSLHVQGALLGAGVWALRISCAGFVVGALGASVNTAQQVRLRWKQYTIFYTAANLIGGLGVPLAIFIFSGGVVTAAAVGLASQLIFLVALAWDGMRIQPALVHPRIDRRTLRTLVSYGGVLTLANFVGIPLMTGERFFLAANAPTSAVAYYAVAATVATTLTVIPEQLTAPLIPALSRLESQGKKSEHRALYQKSLSGVFLLATPATLLLALVARPFLALWAGPAYAAHGTVLLLVALGGAWANTVAWVPASYLRSAAKIKPLAWLQVAELGPYLAAAWVMTAKWGALGAAIVWSARLVLDCVARFLIVRRVAGLPWLPLSQRRARSLAAPALLGAACIGAAAISESLAARAGIAAVLVIAYGVALWSLVLTQKERSGLVGLVHETLGPKMPARWARRNGSAQSPSLMEESRPPGPSVHTEPEEPGADDREAGPLVDVGATPRVRWW